MNGLRARVQAALLCAVGVLAVSVVVAGQETPPAQSGAEWQRKHALGLQHKTAGELYAALRKTAKAARTSPPFSQLPDWSGLWTAAGGGTMFGAGPGGTTPRLTPAAAATLKTAAELEAKGIEYDENLSQCGPPGFPRWLVIPFLREFIVRPEETWLSSETVNNVRRIYTDGRGHPPEADRYPLYYGDSIGFWDDGTLVIHTTQLRARSMGRGQPDQSEQMETVEIWKKVNAAAIEAEVWIYDPTIYVEPWYFVRRDRQVPNPDKALRMNYWHCGENPNNEVFKTPEGGTQFRDFTFTTVDDAKKEQGK
jgi:hypothetical protein